MTRRGAVHDLLGLAAAAGRGRQPRAAAPSPDAGQRRALSPHLEGRSARRRHVRGSQPMPERLRPLAPHLQLRAPAPSAPAGYAAHALSPQRSSIPRDVAAPRVRLRGHRPQGRPGRLLQLQRRRWRISKAFRHQPVALRQTEEDGRLDVHYCAQKIAAIDLRKIQPACGNVDIASAMPTVPQAIKAEKIGRHSLAKEK